MGEDEGRFRLFGGSDGESILLSNPSQAINDEPNNSESQISFLSDLHR